MNDTERQLEKDFPTQTELEILYATVKYYADPVNWQRAPHKGEWDKSELITTQSGNRLAEAALKICHSMRK